MSPAHSPVTDDEETDPSLEASASDADSNADEEEEEEFEEVEEELEEEVEVEEEEEEEVEEEVEEEIEEEEEEYVEEEEQEDAEDEVEEVEEDDKGTLSVSAPDSDKDHKDSSHQMESEEHVTMRAVSSVAENHAAMPSSSMHSKEENQAMLKAFVPSCEILSLNKEEIHPEHEILNIPESRKSLTSATSAEDGKSQVLDADVEHAGTLLQSKTFGGCSEQSCNSKGYLGGVKDINSGATKSSNDSGKDVATDLPQRDFFVDFFDGGQSSLKETTPLDVDVKNACTLVQCKTFGRCSEPSCNSKDYLGGVKVIDSGVTKSSSDTGKDVATGLPQRDCFVNHIAASQNSLKKIMPLEVESKDDVKQMSSRTRTISPIAEMKGHKHQSIICDFFAKGWCIRGSSCSFLHIKDSSNNAGQKAEGEELVNAKQKRELQSEEGIKDNFKRSRMNELEIPSHEKHNFRLRDNLFPESRSVNASSNYFSLNISSYSNCAEGMATIRSQHMYNGSNFSGSQHEDLPLGSSRVPIQSSGYISNICSYDWEPSVPFRPSFFITSMSASSSGDLYDPLRDSIEIPNIGDGSMKAFLLIQGSSIHGSSKVQKYGDSAAIRKHISDFNIDKSSVSPHNKYYGNEQKKGLVPREKDCLATEMEITSGTCTNSPDGNMGMEQNAFGVKDILKADRELTEHDSRHHGEGSGHRKRIHRDKKINDMDVDFQADGSVQKETKALRNFRAILVDLVKELLKPSWYDGRLTKDAHNLIVKKSVDKVLRTLEPHQILTTGDTAKQYVSSCRAKIAKLVSGYVNKYGKP